MFEECLLAAREKVASCLAGELTGYPDHPVIEAMRHGLGGGKCLRGFLVLESARIEGQGETAAIWPAAAVEALHAYSLIHDDLPAMDDDDLRRGRPTVHRKWDEATAILAGDALQALAFGLLTREQIGPADRRISLIGHLAAAAGARGMVLGQAQDIAAESSAVPLTLEATLELQANKTGALFRWAASAGARMAGSDPTALAAYADALGLAFQITDDLLDVEGETATVGKTTGKDAAAGKATFVSLLGVAGARARADELVQLACDALSGYGHAADNLRAAARFVISRRM